MIAADLVQSKT